MLSTWVVVVVVVVPVHGAFRVRLQFVLLRQTCSYLREYYFQTVGK